MRDYNVSRDGTRVRRRREDGVGMTGLVIDLFAGGGGASEGIRLALAGAA